MLRLRAWSVAAASVWTRFRAAQVEWHLTIVHPLLVARLAAEPLLSGADWLDMTRFALGTQCRTWRCQRSQQEKDRRSTRLNSSHQIISYAVFCLKKKKKK